jgi:hypothetical protein
MMVAPSAATARAIALPIPVPAPVMAMILSVEACASLDLIVDKIDLEDLFLQMKPPF